MLPEFKYELTSGSVSKKEFLLVAESLVHALLNQGFEYANLQHGWIFMVDEKFQGKDRTISLSDFMKEVTKGVEKGEIEPCLTKFFLVDVDGTYCIDFCDECDFHFSCDNVKILTRIGEFFLDRSISFYFSKRMDIKKKKDKSLYCDSLNSFRIAQREFGI